MITDQVQFLQEQADAILREASRDTMLHSVACNFVKRPGQVYHLYEKTDGQLYFSMLSPEVNTTTVTKMIQVKIILYKTYFSMVKSTSYFFELKNLV